MNSVWCLSKCKLWTFGLDGSLVIVPNGYLPEPGVCKNATALGETKVNPDCNTPQINFCFSDCYIIKLKSEAWSHWKLDLQDERNHAMALPSFPRYDGFASTEVTRLFRAKFLLCYGGMGSRDEKMNHWKLFLFRNKDKDKIWFTFVPYEDECVQGICNSFRILSVMTGTPCECIISVLDLEQRCKRVRTMWMPIKDKDSLILSDLINSCQIFLCCTHFLRSNTVYFFDVNEWTGRMLQILCKVVKCLELRIREQCDLNSAVLLQAVEHTLYHFFFFDERQ